MTLAVGMVQISYLLCSLVKSTLIQSLISCIFSSLCEYDTTLPCLEVNEHIPPSMTWISEFFLWVKAILASVSNLAPLLTVTWNSKWLEIELVSALFVRICESPAPLESLMMWTNAFVLCWCVLTASMTVLMCDGYLLSLVPCNTGLPLAYLPPFWMLLYWQGIELGRLETTLHTDKKLHKHISVFPNHNCTHDTSFVTYILW